MSRDRLLKQFLRDRFLVTLKTGETFDGLLNQWDESTIELVNAHAVTENDRISVDGTILLARVNIAYMQQPQGRT